MIERFAAIRDGLRLFAAVCVCCEPNDTQNDTQRDELVDPLTW